MEADLNTSEAELGATGEDLALVFFQGDLEAFDRVAGALEELYGHNLALVPEAYRGKTVVNTLSRLSARGSAEETAERETIARRLIN